MVRAYTRPVYTGTYARIGKAPAAPPRKRQSRENLRDIRERGGIGRARVIHEFPCTKRTLFVNVFLFIGTKRRQNGL